MMNGSSTTTAKCFDLFQVTYLEDCVQKINSNKVRHLQLSISLHAIKLYKKNVRRLWMLKLK